VPAGEIGQSTRDKFRLLWVGVVVLLEDVRYSHTLGMSLKERKGRSIGWQAVKTTFTICWLRLKSRVAQVTSGGLCIDTTDYIFAAPCPSYQVTQQT
jgi:hypothetical protein